MAHPVSAGAGRLSRHGSQVHCHYQTLG